MKSNNVINTSFVFCSANANLESATEKRNTITEIQCVVSLSYVNNSNIRKYVSHNISAIALYTTHD
jgi:hypothetical protein